MKQIDRRTFVTAAAAAGATAFASRHSFALPAEALNQAAAPSNQGSREVVAVEAVPFPMKNVRLGPGAFSAAAEANRRYLKILPSPRPAASHVSPDRGAAYFCRAPG